MGIAEVPFQGDNRFETQTAHYTEFTGKQFHTSNFELLPVLCLRVQKKTFPVIKMSCAVNQGIASTINSDLIITRHIEVQLLDA